MHRSGRVSVVVHPPSCRDCPTAWSVLKRFEVCLHTSIKAPYSRREYSPCSIASSCAASSDARPTGALYPPPAGSDGGVKGSGGGAGEGGPADFV